MANLSLWSSCCTERSAGICERRSEVLKYQCQLIGFDSGSEFLRKAIAPKTENVRNRAHVLTKRQKVMRRAQQEIAKASRVLISDKVVVRLIVNRKHVLNRPCGDTDLCDNFALSFVKENALIGIYCTSRERAAKGPKHVQDIGPELLFAPFVVEETAPAEDALPKLLGIHAQCQFERFELLVDLVGEECRYEFRSRRASCITPRRQINELADFVRYVIIHPLLISWRNADIAVGARDVVGP